MSKELEERLRELIEAGLDFGTAVNVFAEQRTERELAYVKVARESCAFKEGETEVDESAIVSEGADDGAYVMSWTWVYADLVEATLKDAE